MAYGILKCDTVTFTNAGVDKSVTLSGLVQNPVFSGNVTVTGTLSGVTVTGTTANFTSGNFTNISGGTHTITSGVFAAGSAASPSITFTGDLNTGIYSPGADQVAVATNGTGRLFINDGGQIGIGTNTSLLYPLNIQSGSGADAIMLRGRLVDDKSTILFVNNGAATNLGWIQVDATGFAIATGSAPTERLRIDATGQIEAASLGTAAAPTFSWTGDPNTGIYSPGADQVAISTNGTGRLFVDASGRLLINNSSAVASATAVQGALQAQGIDGLANANFGRWSNDTAGYAFYFGKSRGVSIGSQVAVSSGDFLGALFFEGSDGTQLRRGASITANVDGAVTSNNVPGRLVFQTALGGTTTERMRITSAGNVGIGLTDPTQPLQVAGNVRLGATTSGTQYSTVSILGDAALMSSSPLLNLTTADGSTRFAYINHTGAGNQLDILNQSNGAFTLGTNNTERLRITSAGLVGVGTSSPFTILHSAISITGGNPATSGTTDANVIARFQGGSVGLDIGGTASGAQWIQPRSVNNFATNYGLLLCPNGGNIGIGTTSPQTPLHVSTANSEQGRFESTGASYINVKGSAGQNLLGVEPGAGWVGPIESIALAFKTGNSERARIDSSGRLLVGTSSALDTSLIGAAAFQVAGGTNATSQLSVSRFSGNSDLPRIALIKSRSGTVGSNTIVQNGDGLGEVAFIGADGSGATGYPFAASIGAYVDGTPGANDMPGRLVFSTTADGASSPTERMRIANNGAITVSNAADNIFASSNVSPGTSNFFFLGFTSGSSRVVIWNNGNVVNTNNSYGAISDAKLKENIVDATSQWSDIKALQVRKYNFKEGQTHTQIGLIAQEVEQVSPGLVSESPDRDAEGNDLGTVTKSVNYSVLYMKAVKALQEAMERIETLEAKVAALESA